MRLLVLGAVLCGGNAVAQSSPPSKTLERAIKLYEKEDYWSTSIELKKVIDGETDDARENVERAEFFLGKTFVKIQFPAAALAMFDKIAQSGGSHRYHEASIKWIVELLDLSPDVGHGIIGAYDPAAVTSPSLDETSRDGFRFHLGVHLLRAGNRTGIEMLGKIRRDSQYRPRAALHLAERHLANRADKEGLAEAQLAARDPAIADDAVRLIVAATRGTLSKEAAQDALAAIAKTNALAQLELSRLQIEAGRAAMVDVSVGGFETIAIASACTNRPFVEMVGTATARIEEMLERDDNAEAYEHIIKKRRDPVYAVLLAERSARDAFAWVTVLNEQIVHHRKSDRAWQTTVVAAEILQELTVQQSVAAADAGKFARTQIDSLAKDLMALRELGESPAAKRIVVPPSLCTSILGMPARIAEPTPQRSLPVPPPKKASGCAGCSSNNASGFALVALIGLVAFRRRR